MVTNRISINYKIHFGKPCVTGTRIPVQNVLELVRDGIPVETIITDYYAALTPEGIHACIDYAANAMTQDIHP